MDFLQLFVGVPPPLRVFLTGGLVAQPDGEGTRGEVADSEVLLDAIQSLNVSNAAAVALYALTRPALPG